MLRHINLCLSVTRHDDAFSAASAFLPPSLLPVKEAEEGAAEGWDRGASRQAGAKLVLHICRGGEDRTRVEDMS